MVTVVKKKTDGSGYSVFPINRCHQRVVTVTVGAGGVSGGKFPINRCHQRVVTPEAWKAAAAGALAAGFQSIGVTSER